jgi:hypothetical protein
MSRKTPNVWENSPARSYCGVAVSSISRTVPSGRMISSS